MSGRSSWQTTTHDWGKDLDLDHLNDMRSQFEHGSVAGGRRHLILEVLAYANDEAESLGRQGKAVVVYQANGRVTVSDDGRGTDTRTDTNGSSVRKPVMATPDVRFVGASPPFLLPDQLPRRGMSSVAALSPELIHNNCRVNGCWSQTYRYGVPDSELRMTSWRGTTGTEVTFHTQVDGASELEPADLVAFPWLAVRVDRV